MYLALDFTGYEIKFVELVQKLTGNPIVDKAFIYISYLGEAYLFIVIGLLLYWLIDKKWAYQFIIGFLGSTILVGGLKALFKRLRPYQASETIRSVGKPATEAYGETSYAFPSGHSNTASSISTGVLKKSKNKLINTLMILNVILIPFSRIYLGQHYLTDVLAGVTLGYLVVSLVYMLFDKTNKEEWIGIVLIPIFLILIAVIIFGEVERLYNKQLFQAAGAIIAFAFGYFIDKKFIKFNPKDNRIWVQILKFVIGLAVLVGIQQGLKIVFAQVALPSGYETVGELGFNALRYFIMALWASLIAPLLFKAVFRINNGEVKVKKSRNRLPYQEA